MMILPIERDPPRIRDVTLRDGLQDNTPISIEAKVAIFEGLVAAGVTSLEIGSFVRPDRVPAMADTAELVARTARLDGAIERWVLVLNRRGVELATDVGAGHIQFVVSVSDAHSLENAGRSSLEALSQFESVAASIPEETKVELTVATAFGCPFSGPVAPEIVLDLLRHVQGLPFCAVTLADTIGTAVPNEVEYLVGAASAMCPDMEIGIHLHDTRGLGLVNAVAAMRAGVKRIDAGLGGLGGCPFAPGASGNLPTEDLVHLLAESGVPTGIDLDRLLATAELACSALGVPVGSHLADAGPRFRRQD